ncbi:hypothetical protein IAU60_001021 [Kwoniella sp. DSM 27419]
MTRGIACVRWSLRAVRSWCCRPLVLLDGRPRIPTAIARRPIVSARTLVGSTTAQASTVHKEIDTPRDGTNRGLAQPGLPGDAPLTTGITLRPYQADAIQACLDALSSGLRRIGVSSPTGSGKTTMFMHLIPLVQFDSPSRGHPVDGRGERGRTLILVGSVELANQAEAAAKRILGDAWTVEVEQSKRHATGRADITIATYQTLNNPVRLAKFDPDRFKLIIVDEAHHAAAHSYLRLLHYFNNAVTLPSTLEALPSGADSPSVPIIGFSATFSRPDQLALSAVFEKIVFHREISSMLEDKWLAPAKSTTVYAELGLDSVELGSGGGGDFKASSLAERVNTDDVNELVVGTYLLRAAQRRSTLVFCVDLAHVTALTTAFRAAGVDARSISSMSRSDVRKETIAAFGRGDFPVLVNCEVLTEGTDIPEIDCILLARPTRSRNLLAQMVGRGLRLSPETGKTDCHIIDIVDSVGRANGMLVSPTLWGLSHEEREERERVLGEGNGAAVPGVRDQDSDYEITYVDQDDPFRLAPNNRPVLERTSRNSWVACGKGKYILEAMGNGYLAITLSEPGSAAKYTITYRHAIPPELAGVRGRGSPFGRVKTVGHADDLERAVQTGDKYAERQMGRDLHLQLSRYAPWRQKPASQKAIQLVMKMQGEDGSASLVDDDGRARRLSISGKEISAGELTAGQVSSWLCAVKHGGKSARMAQDRTAARAEAKRLAKEEKDRLHRERNLSLPESA